MSRGLIDQQVLDLTGGDRFQVFRDRGEMEAVDELGLLYDAPSLTDEIYQVAPRLFSSYLL
jgi:hypothetical protein